MTETTADVEPGSSPRLRWLRVEALAVVFTLELLAVVIARTPAALRFEGHAFGDWGANLTVHDLVRSRLTPAVDFVYPYGLLSIIVGRVWFWVAGASPLAYFEAMLVAHAASALALARFLVARKAGWGGAVLVGAAMPYVVPAVHSNFAHALEVVLLSHAVAYHAEGRRGRALVLATIAALCKPSMAYVYGLLVLICLFAAEGRRAWRSLVPAVGVGALLLIGLAVAYGPRAVVATQWPADAAENYRANQFGFFFGSGRNYWLPADAGLEHYLGTQRGWWIAATIVLVAGGFVGLIRWVRKEAEDSERLDAEIPWVLAGAHVTFICLFFGNEFSWIYYSFLLVMGVVSVAGLGRGWVAAVWLLGLLGLLSARGVPGEIRGIWRELVVSEATSGLYATPEAAGEWREARGYWEGKQGVVLSWSGHSAVVDPALGGDVRFFVMPGMNESADAERLAKVVAKAEVVVLPTANSQSFTDYLTRECRPVAEAMEGTRAVYRGTWVEVYKRNDSSNDEGVVE